MINIAKRNDAADRREVAELIGLFGAARTERLLDVHYTTVRRWERGEVTPPKAVLIALRGAVHGTLPGMDSVKSPWKGWAFAADGLLYSPEGRGFTPGNLRAIEYKDDLIKDLQRTAYTLREEVKRMLQWNNSGANDALFGPLAPRLLPLPANLLDAPQRPQTEQATEQRQQITQLENGRSLPAIEAGRPRQKRLRQKLIGEASHANPARARAPSAPK